MRSYRTHNLWFDQYMEKARVPRLHSFHIGIFKRLAKTYSGHRVLCTIWAFTVISALKATTNFSKEKESDPRDKEVYFRLLTLFEKNKFGFNTRVFADFDVFLEAVVNERFLDDNSAYYDDPITGKEIEDVEMGLVTDPAEGDVQYFMRTKHEHHGEGNPVWKFPDRVGTNYSKDDLSPYKLLPQGMKNH